MCECHRSAVCVGGPSSLPPPCFHLPLVTFCNCHFIFCLYPFSASLTSQSACLPVCLCVRLSVCLSACLPVGFSLLSCIHFHNPCVSRAYCLILQSAHAVWQRWNCVTVKTEHGHIQLQLIAKRHRLSFINVSTSWTLSNGALPSLAWD